MAFVNTRLSDSTASSVDRLVQCERRIVSQFRRLRDTAARPPSTDLAHSISIELLQLGLGIEIIELRERDSVCFPFYFQYYLSLTFKLLYATQPPYLYDLISLQTPRNTRSSSVNRSCLKITSRSFRYASPHLWNQLPHSLRQPRLDLPLPDSSLLHDHVISRLYHTYLPLPYHSFFLQPQNFSFT